MAVLILLFLLAASVVAADEGDFLSFFLFSIARVLYTCFVIFVFLCSQYLVLVLILLNIVISQLFLRVYSALIRSARVFRFSLRS